MKFCYIVHSASTAQIITLTLNRLPLIACEMVQLYMCGVKHIEVPAIPTGITKSKKPAKMDILSAWSSATFSNLMRVFSRINICFKSLSVFGVRLKNVFEWQSQKLVNAYLFLFIPF